MVAVAAPWGDFRGGALDKTRLRGSAHEFMVDLRCGRYAVALGQNLSEFLGSAGSGLYGESRSGGQSPAATLNLVSLQAHACLWY